MIGVLAAVIVFLVVVSKFILERRLLGVLLEVLSVRIQIKHLSVQALNIWWPIQYWMNVERVIPHFGRENALRGVDGSAWFRTLEVEELKQRFGVWPIHLIHNFLFLAFSALNIYLVIRSGSVASVVLGSAQQIFTYFMFRIGLHNNHYFSMIPLFGIIAAIDPAFFWVFSLLVIVFLLQDLIFYGLGRDMNYGLIFLSRTRTAPITILLSGVNFVVYLMIFGFLWKL
jgi:hypothetical protein